jgi:hypothetical protein
MSVKYNPLPGKLYMVEVPTITTYSEEELAIMGMPVTEYSTGKKDYDDLPMTRVMLPITRMIDIYSDGMPIKLIDRSKVVEIYTALEEYISDRNKQMPMLNAEVIEDNRDVDIDRFAEEVLNYSKHTIVNALYNKPSGFDIGLNKIDVVRPVKTNHNVRGRRGVLAAYRAENPVQTTGLPEDVYLTHKSGHVDPDKVKRKPRVRRRARTYSGVNNESKD